MRELIETILMGLRLLLERLSVIGKPVQYIVDCISLINFFKPIRKDHIVKYGLRYIVSILIIILCVIILPTPSILERISHGIVLTLSAAIISEVIWVLFFRRLFGSFEQMIRVIKDAEDKTIPVVLFVCAICLRGITFGVCVVGFTTGL